MFNLKSAPVTAAGAYVSVNGLYPFQIGWKPHNDNYPVVRLGGHVEENETAWQCALREVKEEAGVTIRAVQTGKTYLVRAEDPDLTLREMRWEHGFHGDVEPFLVVVYGMDKDPRLSLMFLAESDEEPVPSMEVKGLLFLRPQDIHQICQEMITLQQYLKRGGKAVLSEPFDRDKVLEPFIQLRIFSGLLRAVECMDFQNPVNNL